MIFQEQKNNIIKITDASTVYILRPNKLMAMSSIKNGYIHISDTLVDTVKFN